MGAYFAATGLGNKVAGYIGGLSENAGDFEVFLQGLLSPVLFLVF